MLRILIDSINCYMNINANIFHYCVNYTFIVAGYSNVMIIEHNYHLICLNQFYARLLKSLYLSIILLYLISIAHYARNLDWIAVNP